MSFLGKPNKRGPRSGTRTKNQPANRPQPTIPITIESIEADGAVLMIEFNKSVALDGVPQYTTDVEGAVPIDAVLVTPTKLALTYSESVAAATELNVPYEEPGIRDSSGGYVFPSAFPFGAEAAQAGLSDMESPDAVGDGDVRQAA